MRKITIIQIIVDVLFICLSSVYNIINYNTLVRVLWLGCAIIWTIITTIDVRRGIEEHNENKDSSKIWKGILWTV